VSRVLLEFRGSGGALIRIVHGDLTLERTDAIVNAANGALKLGGGVAGAIRKRGGPGVQEECDRWVLEKGEVPTGGAAITGGGDLEARHVIHAVGPVWGSGDEDRKLARAVSSALALARDHGCASVALPAISSGIFGFPKERCAEVILGEASGFRGLEEIRLTNLDEETARIFYEEAERLRTRAGGAG
jgi:O-acetyl-ADP-ribose deacetylase (regulator of RNase III)